MIFTLLHASGARRAIETDAGPSFAKDTTVIDHFRERSRDRFITLDAMRGVAAISVMMFHYLLGISLHLFTQAYYGVDFFFCLSGIILTHSYEAKIASGMSFSQFFGRRLVRLYPFYIIGFILSLMLLQSYKSFSPIDGFQLRNYILSVLLGAFFIPYPIIWRSRLLVKELSTGSFLSTFRRGRYSLKWSQA